MNPKNRGQKIIRTPEWGSYYLRMVYPTGVEPATLGVGVLRSIQLSYGYISSIYYTRIFRKSKGFLHIPEKFSV